MREYVFVRHEGPVTLIKASDFKNKKRKLKSIRRDGMWAFVEIPPESLGQPCEVHYWHRANKSPLDVAMMLGHELGHIGDGGPKEELGYRGEEDRADEFGLAAEGALWALMKSGVLAPAARQGRRRRRSSSPRRKR